MYRYTTLVVLCMAMMVGARAPLAAGGARAEVATLKKIASRVDARAGIISIEASDPVPYVASQPDPRLFVIELRDTLALGFADNFTPDARHPFAAVQVETGQAADGTSVARVRMMLAQPMRPRVRSSRNVIYVEADRLDRAVRTAGTIATSGPSSAIRDVRVARRGAATAVTLHATGRLAVSGVEESKEGPPRLVIDLPNATSALPGTTPVGTGPVDAVRIGLNADSPLVTRVVMDLTRKAPYRLEASPDGNDLTVIFDEALADPSSAEPAALRVLQPPVLQAAAALQPPSQPSPALQALAFAGQAPRTALAAQAGPQAAAPPVIIQQPAAPPVAQQAAAPPAAQQPGQPAPSRFTGFPVSLDFQGADLRAVLRTFAEISGLNIVIDPSVQGTVDVALRDVPWDQALDIILRANRLGYVVDGTIVRIAPLTALADEEAQRQKLAEAQALAGTLQTLTRTLSYAKAEELQPLLLATALSQRGSITNDVRTNTLIITDLGDRLARALELISTLDQPQPQVEIEARIVRTTRVFARELGVRWGLTGQATPAFGNTLPLAFPNQAVVGGRAPLGEGVDQTAGATVVNLGAGAASSAIGLALGAINGALNLDLALSALEEQGQGRVLSTPRVTTQNNVPAEVSQGAQIPVQTTANNTTTTVFIDAMLKLTVTPQITSADTVIMDVLVENSSVNRGVPVINGTPPIDTQRATTKVLVSNGETTVIGGVYVSQEATSQLRTPGFYRIPLLGWLFKNNRIDDSSEELLIFITPRIIKQ